MPLVKSMKTIKVAKELYVPVERIEWVCEYEPIFIINMVREIKKTAPEKVIDITRHKKIKSIIYLTNGTYILSPLSAETINQRLIKEDSLD